MSAEDAGFYSIKLESDKTVQELYKDRFEYAKKYLLESKLDSALDMIDDMDLYSKELTKRNIEHTKIDYKIIEKEICEYLLKNISKKFS